MGYIRDHAIVVVGTYDDWLDRAHAKARDIFSWVSPISPEAVNGSQSFFVPPDGSKEGWDTSYEGDDRRNRFIGWLREQVYEDGSSPLKWVEVRVSDDGGDVHVERSSEDTRTRGTP